MNRLCYVCDRHATIVIGSLIIAFGAAWGLQPTPVLADPPASATTIVIPDDPPMPPRLTRTSQTIDVKVYGAVGNGVVDDTDAIQRVLTLAPVNASVVFPKGTYRYSRALRVRVAGTKLKSDGAVLYASDPNVQAVVLEGNRTALLGFKMTANVGEREGGDHTKSRIVVQADGVRVENNHVSEGSASGIYVRQASNYLISGNTIENTLADGIHNTRGSRNGHIVNNVLRNNGDDRIAVVSYVSSKVLVSDILIANNDIGDGPWGRGIAIIGGQNIVIRRNNVADIANGGGILVARERPCDCFGVHNVLIEDNTIERIQVAPDDAQKTGQAAIDIYSPEAADADSALMVDNVTVRNNRIGDIWRNGVRVRGLVCDAHLEANELSGVQVEWAPINVSDLRGGPECTVTCAGNTYEGLPVSSSGCVDVASPTPLP